jgi:hypothetical protein
MLMLVFAGPQRWPGFQSRIRGWLQRPSESMSVSESTQSPNEEALQNAEAPQHHQAPLQPIAQAIVWAGSTERLKYRACTVHCARSTPYHFPECRGSDQRTACAGHFVLSPSTMRNPEIPNGFVLWPPITELLFQRISPSSRAMRAPDEIDTSGLPLMSRRKR